MDLEVNDLIKRANNELVLAESVKLITEDAAIKLTLNVPDSMTFYSSVISHSYYSIFYAAKALLLTKKIRPISPEIHKKAFDAFKKEFVDTGILDVSLLEIYKKAIIRSDELLEIFKDEKWKRGNFTYQTIPQANKEPAEESLKNAKRFVANIAKVIEISAEKSMAASKKEEKNGKNKSG